ncbi:hypothetical protein M9H77_30443 [Catharanthus roseus]|uniref:Uncharacterized protein n=1 Tax=Catharanthus roseus TaxID=4058 RepID=A0ACB9ZY60_CATRO|nr:hypothetical protein M9H77_30443 [Catharanthus roseus]
MKIKRLNEMEDEEKGRKGITLKANEDDQTYSSNNEDEVDDDEEMTLIMRKFKRFYKKCSNDDFQKLVLENKNLCEKISFLEKCLIDYDVLKKKVSDLTLSLVLLDWEPVGIIIGLDTLHGGLASRIVKAEVFLGTLDKLPISLAGRILVELESLTLTVFEVGFASIVGRTTLDFVSKSAYDSHSCKTSSRVWE